MKSLIVLCVVGVVALGVSAAWADDTTPPPWTRGDPGTTYQKWEFGTSDLTPSPEVDYINPLGPAVLEVTGSTPFTVWLASDDGREGVWKYEDYVQIDILNFNEENPYKEIWLQLTYAADGGSGLDSLITTSPTSTMELIEKTQVSTLYWHATWSLIIEPNPQSETIYIQPRDCTMYLDELVIDTICVPEPLTICLFGLGGLALLRRRRA